MPETLVKDQPTKTQLDVIRRMITESPTLHRVPGGFWCTVSTPRRSDGLPEWAVDIRTVEAMERKGILQRSGMHLEAWRDERVPGPRFDDYRAAFEMKSDMYGEGGNG